MGYSFKIKFLSTVKVLYWFPRDIAATLWKLMKLKRYINSFSVAEVRTRYQQENVGNSNLNKALDDVLENYSTHYSENLVLETSSSKDHIRMLGLLVSNWKSLQQMRWLYRTKFFSDFSDGALSKFYSTGSVSQYNTFSRLANEGWVEHRTWQFVYLNSLNEFTYSEKSYIEVGGSTGLLPIIADRLGFNDVVNYEIAEADQCFSKRFSSLFPSSNLRVKGDLENEGVFSIISCHQVVEHVCDAEAFLKGLSALMDEESILFLSTGYHVFPHPGHFPLDHYEFIRILFKLGLKIIATGPEETYILVIKKCTY